MVRHHVTECAGCLVEAASLFHTNRFRRSDLHMVNSIAIPYRFKQTIGEAERHNVLNRILAEEMVDPKDLILVQCALDAGVQFARRVEAVAKRLVEDDASPKWRLAALVFALIGELRLTELLDDGAEQAVGDREIKDDIPTGALGLLRLAENIAQIVVELGLGQVAANIRHLCSQLLPGVFVDMVGVEFRSGTADKTFQHVVKLITPAFYGFVRAGNADQRELLRQDAGAQQIVKRRYNKPLGQIPGCAKNHHGTGIGRFSLSPWRASYQFRSGRRASRRFVEHCSTRPRSGLRFVAKHSALVLDQSALDPRHGRRSRGASPKAFSRRRCDPAGSENG